MINDIEIPLEYDNKSYEYVSFTYSRNKSTPCTVEKGACYACCMPFLPECEFLLFPLKSTKKSPLGFDKFCEFINLCKQNKIVAGEVEPRQEGDRNLLFIPNTGKNKHLVYSTLCFYRFTENQPGVPYAILEGMKRGNLNFFQLFHYASLRRCTWAGHVFSSIYCTSVDQKELGKTVYGYELYKRAFSLNHSIAIKKFYFDDEISNFKDAGYTSNNINNIATKIGSDNDFFIKKTINFLNPLLTPLYDKVENYKEIIDQVNG